jgi:hypothetical protein
MSVFITAYRAGDVTVRQSSLAQYNLWREYAYPELYMGSDALHMRLKSLGTSFFKMVKATEI